MRRLVDTAWLPELDSSPPWCRVHRDVGWLEDTAWLPELGRTPSYMDEFTINYECLSVVPYGNADEAYSLTHGGPYGIKWCRVHRDEGWLKDTAWLPELGSTPSYMDEVTRSCTERPGLAPPLVRCVPELRPVTLLVRVYHHHKL
jgi:hypothetical protein